MKKVRQSQLISPWGIGQIVNFPDNVSHMVAGLDAWEEVTFKWLNIDGSLEEFIIHEERLEKQLEVDHFRLPPDYREKGVQNSGLTIPFVNFPLWYYCPRCGSMEKRTLYASTRMHCKGKGPFCHNESKSKRPRLIPVRFITVCKEGHIEDFPFYEWVHDGKECEKNYGNNELRMITGKSSSLAGIEIVCKCGKRRNMSGAFGHESLKNIKKCSGSRPWLGEVDEKAKGCGQELRVVQKGASNVYFPVVKGAIYLPKYEETDPKTAKALDKIMAFWNKGKSTIKGSEYEALKNIIQYIAIENNIDSDKLLELALKRIDEVEKKQEQKQEEKDKKNLDIEIRLPEYKAILAGVGRDNQDLYVKVKDSKEYKDVVSQYFKSVALVHKLMETRAFLGFTRLEPPDHQNIKNWRSQLAKRPVKWLPAVQVRGEGIFLEFDNKKLNYWANNQFVKDRIQKLEKNLGRNKWYRNFSLNPKFVLLHTFSHLLINQLSFDCGYGSSSIRERIYCSQDCSDDIMNGILIYTAASDSEGSMGGLVRQGLPGRLENVIYASIQNARWCSSDPVCIQSTGQGPDSCNLAACHNCTLLPETSCEFGNRILDRALIIGTEEVESVGFFSSVKSEK